MKKGKVKFYNSKSGFGFIIESQSGNEYYFKEKNLIENVEDNDLVEFDLIEAKRGFEAIKIKKTTLE
jgi:CspA family cold shock protein